MAASSVLPTEFLPSDEPIPAWWPEHAPIYDIHKSYYENADSGPFMTQPLPHRPQVAKEDFQCFLGQSVMSKIGVPAGPLLNSRWIALAAAVGFDIVTYKTIRSIEWQGHPLPNILYIDPEEMRSNADPCHTIASPPSKLDDVAITNSFGMQSRTKEYLRADIPAANASLADGQVMIVSVVGTPSSDATIPQATRESMLVDDYVQTALFAKECGARIIEANFSCPNVCSGGSIYCDPAFVKTISGAMTSALGDTPLIIKVGAYHDLMADESKATSLLRDVMRAATEAKVAAICGINTLSRRVVTVDPSNKTEVPALGESRLTSGVCGGVIRASGLRSMKAMSALRKADSFLGALTLIGCGGITEAHHFEQYFKAGADAATTATGMMWDPYLAARYHEAKKLKKLT